MGTPQENPTKSAAVIVGIDNYPNQPLTSAVNDANAFRQALLDLGLVKKDDISLIVAPQGGAPDDASYDNIWEVLRSFYQDPDRYDRLFFFFAGHGISVYTNEARNVIRPVLLAQDVKDLVMGGRYMIDVLELRNLLRGYGPKEQIFVIDACRDLSYEEYPNVASLAWGSHGGAVPPANNHQATLYAVSPLGKALGTVGEQGVMTTHLLTALKSDSLAVDYSVGHNNWQVSMRSLAGYVKEKVQETLKDKPAWRRIYMLPELDAPDPPVSALRSWAEPTPVPLTVHITPDQAASNTQVKVILRGVELPKEGLPPHQNHETRCLPPQHYLLKASNPTDTVSPEEKTVDVRRQSEFTVQVTPGRPFTTKGGPTPPAVPAGDAPAYPEVTIRTCPACGQRGRISAEAHERYTRVEVDGLEPPFKRQAAWRDLALELAPGPYRVSFRQGDEVFSQGDVYLMPGQEAVVKPGIAYTPLVGEVLGVGDKLPKTVQISESLGDLQGGLRDIMLPMIGVKPFDEHDHFFGHFRDLVEKAPPNPTGNPWLSVVVAVDGDGWSVDPLQVLESVHLEVHNTFEESKAQSMPLHRLRRSTLRDYPSSGPALQRIRLGLLPARLNSGRLVIRSELFGDFELAIAAGAQRVTVITLTLQPDGRLAISQSLMPFPGKAQLYIDRGEPHTDPSVSRLVKNVRITQDLYRSSDLATASWGLLDEIAYTKWLELSASCLAFYAWQERLQQEGQDNSDAREKWLLIADNLHHYFSDLPDPEVIFGQAYPDQSEAVYTRLLEADQVPILAESARRLALYAEQRDFNQAAVVRWARRIPAGQMWSVISH